MKKTILSLMTVLATGGAQAADFSCAAGEHTLDVHVDLLKKQLTYQIHQGAELVEKGFLPAGGGPYGSQKISLATGTSGLSFDDASKLQVKGTSVAVFRLTQETEINLGLKAEAEGKLVVSHFKVGKALHTGFGGVKPLHYKQYSALEGAICEVQGL